MTKQSVINTLKEIVNSQSHQKIKFKRGITICDLYTASLLVSLHDNLNEENKDLMQRRLQDKGWFMTLTNYVYNKAIIKE